MIERKKGMMMRDNEPHLLNQDESSLSSLVGLRVNVEPLNLYDPINQLSMLLSLIISGDLPRPSLINNWYLMLHR
jgi:hypothetical protein